MVCSTESASSFLAGADDRERDPAAPRQESSVAKVVSARTIGTVIEWYDFFINASAAALVFGPLFFPASNPTISALAALSIDALGYRARSACSNPRAEGRNP